MCIRVGAPDTPPDRRLYVATVGGVLMMASLLGL